MNRELDPFEAVVCERCGRIEDELPPEWETDETGEHLVCAECLTPTETAVLHDQVESLGRLNDAEQ